MRTDPQANAFLITLKSDPAWKDITRRVTISLKDDTVIEDIKISSENNDMSLYSELPHGIVGTKAIVYYDVMAAHTDSSKGIKAEHLARVWRISNEEAERTLEVT